LFERVGHEARPASTLCNLLKTLAQSGTMWLIFLVLGPAIIWNIERALGWSRFYLAFAWQREITVALFAAGWLLAWCSAFFLVTRGQGTPLPAASPCRLVIVGPYRHIRNPMALASLGQGAAIALFFGSPLMIAYISIGIMLWNYFARPWEEYDLERRFGEDYRRYKSQVRCWVPRLKPYVGIENEECRM
jgi:protein-S-isoprenylcysteine O-methyltransferase Ste14